MNNPIMNKLFKLPIYFVIIIAFVFSAVVQHKINVEISSLIDQITFASKYIIENLSSWKNL